MPLRARRNPPSITKSSPKPSLPRRAGTTHLSRFPLFRRRWAGGGGAGGGGGRRPAPPAAGAPAAPEVCASFDGKWEALIQNYNVFLRPAGSAAEATPLSLDGSEGNYYTVRSMAWSPDSRKLAA